jgi:hypothetical protein
MDVPTPPHAVLALAAFVRQRLAEVTDTLAPLWTRRDDVEVLPDGHGRDGHPAATHLAMVIVAAGAPFAATSHARVRLLRQMHASGLLKPGETERH